MTLSDHKGQPLIKDTREDEPGGGGSYNPCSKTVERFGSNPSSAMTGLGRVIIDTIQKCFLPDV
jgi:hypothetical protein